MLLAYWGIDVSQYSLIDVMRTTIAEGNWLTRMFCWIFFQISTHVFGYSIDCNEMSTQKAVGKLNLWISNAFGFDLFHLLIVIYLRRNLFIWFDSSEPLQCSLLFKWSHVSRFCCEEWVSRTSDRFSFVLARQSTTLARPSQSKRVSYNVIMWWGVHVSILVHIFSSVNIICTYWGLDCIWCTCCRFDALRTKRNWRWVICTFLSVTFTHLYFFTTHTYITKRTLETLWFIYLFIYSLIHESIHTVILFFFQKFSNFDRILF
jgi:hypothetical protein